MQLRAAVPMTVLGLTSSAFIQALVDFVFVLRRKPPFTACLLAHLRQGIDADTVPGYYRYLPGLPLTFSLNPSKPLHALALLAGLSAALAYFTIIDVPVPAPGVVARESNPIPIVAEVSGRIRTIHIHEGTRVRRGDVLIQLDIRELSLKKNALEARIHFTELRPAERRVRAELSGLYHDLLQAHLDLDRMTIVAPADGQITSFAELHPGEALSPGTAIAALAQGFKGD